MRREIPDPSAPEQRVAFGTSGHRGSSFTRTFNERHILAITQAICLYRKQRQIDGPLFLGMDTHALSVPALTTALEVLAANEVEVMLSQGDEHTPPHGSLRVRRGPRLSTRSTRRASGDRAIWLASWRRPRASLPRNSRQDRSE